MLFSGQVAGNPTPISLVRPQCPDHPVPRVVALTSSQSREASGALWPVGILPIVERQYTV